MQKVGILYICTGQYNMFWKGFYETAEQYLLKDLPYEIHYFVFSDDDKLPYLDSARVHYHFQEKQGWPWPTLLRFRTFYSIKNELTDFDYLYFFNSNIEFVAPVTQELIPPTGLNFTFTHHFAYYQKPEHTHTYDRNPQSNAYIPFGKGQFYVSGGCLGGRAKPFLEMSAILDHRIKSDLKNNIIALWHDESQINKYILGRKDIHTIHPGYFYPEIFKLDFPMICKALEKYKYFPVAQFKEKTKEEKQKEWFQKKVVDRFLKPPKGSLIFITLSTIQEERYFQYFFAKSMKKLGYRVQLIDEYQNEKEYSILKLKKASSSHWKIKFANKKSSKYQWLEYFEKTMAFHEEIFEHPSIVNHGLWISEMYFSSISNEVRGYFSDQFKEIKNELAPKCSKWNDEKIVFYDYSVSEFNPMYHQATSVELIKKAIELIKKQDTKADLIWIGQNKDRFEQLNEGEFLNSKNLSKEEIIYLLSQGKHNIVGHDLISWWGAWLNTNVHKIVVAEKQFFNDFRDDSTTIYPENWKIL